MSKPVKPRSSEELMREQMLVKHLAGSHAYGTAIETSDVDYRGVFCADPVNVRTPFFPIREATDVTEEDTKLYELAHFMKLVLECNPNVVETLWVHPDDLVMSTPAYELLRENRYKLLSSRVAYTTSGYALSQLKRIKGHNKWINNPQSEEAPKPYQYLSMAQWFGKEKNLSLVFNLDELRPESGGSVNFLKNHRLVPYGNNLYGVVPFEGFSLWNVEGRLNTQWAAEINRGDLPDPVMLLKFNEENYKTAKERHNQYWTWKKERNVTRGALEEQFGYDTKHAMHLVRLLRMGLEALRDGEFVVRRPDAAELLEVRDGKWTYEQVVEYATEMDNEVCNVWYHKTHLPKKPNMKFAAQLLMDVQDLVWNKND